MRAGWCRERGVIERAWGVRRRRGRSVRVALVRLAHSRQAAPVSSPRLSTGRICSVLPLSALDAEFPPRSPSRNSLLKLHRLRRSCPTKLKVGHLERASSCTTGSSTTPCTQKRRGAADERSRGEGRRRSGESGHDELGRAAERSSSLGVGAGPLCEVLRGRDFVRRGVSRDERAASLDAPLGSCAPLSPRRRRRPRRAACPARHPHSRCAHAHSPARRHAACLCPSS